MTPSNTYGLPSELTDQAIFDKVAAHLIKQGRPALYAAGEVGVMTCAYRGSDGTACAVGCLIPDSQYTEDFEGLGVHDLLDEFVEAFSPLGSFATLLSALQTAHDHNQQWGKPEIIERLQMVAARFDLSTSVLEVQPS